MTCNLSITVISRIRAQFQSLGPKKESFPDGDAFNSFAPDVMSTCLTTREKVHFYIYFRWKYLSRLVDLLFDSSSWDQKLGNLFFSLFPLSYFQHSMKRMKETLGVNFTNVLWAAFKRADPKSTKKTVNLISFLCFWDLCMS